MNKEYKELYHEAERAYHNDPRSEYMTLTEFIMQYIDDGFIEEAGVAESRYHMISVKVTAKHQ